MKRPKPHKTSNGIAIPTTYVRWTQDEMVLMDELLATTDDDDLESLRTYSNAGSLTVEDPVLVANRMAKKLEQLLTYVRRAEEAEMLTA